MDTLLTLIGLGDPFGTGLGEDRPITGPVFDALRERRYARVVLLAPLGREAGAEALRRDLADGFPETQVIVEGLGQSEEDPVGLVTGVISVIEPLIEQGVIVPRRTAAYAAPAGPVVMAAWLMLSTGALEGITLLDPGLGAYPAVPDDDIEARGRSPGRTLLREPLAAYGTTTGNETTEGAEDRRAWHAARRLGLCGDHVRLREAIETAAAVAGHRVPVLVQGETGTGKSLFARLVHDLSDRPDGPFVSVNCAALPEKLVESTLFGHRKGAFTGATDHQHGKFTLADGGTLFLDEIGELPLALQPKLLKVLDDRMVEPVGASKGHRVDTRVLAATNRDLREDVAEGRFREDLYYRIAFGLIRVPPLRERADDIPRIAEHLLDRLNAGLRVPKRLSPEALTFLRDQPWQGNVRDLENVIGRSALLCREDTIGPGDLLLGDAPRARGDAAALPEPHEMFSLEDFLAGTRRTLIRRALEMSHGNQSAAARKLGISPQAVSQFVQREGPQG